MGLCASVMVHRRAIHYTTYNIIISISFNVYIFYSLFIGFQYERRQSFYNPLRLVSTIVSLSLSLPLSSCVDGTYTHTKNGTRVALTMTIIILHDKFESNSSLVSLLARPFARSLARPHVESRYTHILLLYLLAMLLLYIRYFVNIT